MSGLDLDRCRSYATRTDGTRTCLVDTDDLYANHSAVPMVEDVLEADGSSAVALQHDRMLQALLSRLAPEEPAWRVLLLLLWRKLLEKERPLRILWAGGPAHAWEAELLAPLPQFHARTRLWRLNGASPRSGGADVHMEWNALLLPVQDIDVLIVEDDGEHVPLAAAAALFSAVKPWGLVLAASRDASWHEAAGACGQADAYRAGEREEDGVITCATLVPLVADALREASPAGAAASLAAAVRERLTLAASCMAEPPSAEAAETLCETARQVEQMIVQLFPSLHSQTMKYHVSEWKRALIAYILGHGAWTEVQDAFAALRADAAAEDGA